MLRPSIFEDRFFDDFFRFPEGSHLRNAEHSPISLMQTDIKESDDGYTLIMNVPEFKKEDVKAELKDGNLTIHASTSSSNEEKDDDDKYIRRERYYGSCSRSFYVGKDLKQEDIKAKFENGTLTLFIPKNVEHPEVEESNFISIE